MRRWAFTIWTTDATWKSDQKVLEEACKQHADKDRWVYQLERGEESKRLHFQGRISFKTPKRAGEVCPKLGLEGHASVEHDTSSSEFYVLKDETRVEGPWSGKDPAIRRIPRQFRHLHELSSWQRTLVEVAKTFDARAIDVVIDELGGCGKSALCGWLYVNGGGHPLPAFTDGESLSAAVLSLKEQQIYIFDKPRGLAQYAGKKGDAAFYASVEQLKNGYVYDKRYQYKCRWQDAPSIWVFCNQRPDLSLLSADRWRFWEIRERGPGGAGELWQVWGTPAAPFVESVPGHATVPGERVEEGTGERIGADEGGDCGAEGDDGEVVDGTEEYGVDAVRDTDGYDGPDDDVKMHVQDPEEEREDPIERVWQGLGGAYYTRDEIVAWCGDWAFNTHDMKEINEAPYGMDIIQMEYLKTFGELGSWRYKADLDQQIYEARGRLMSAQIDE